MCIGTTLKYLREEKGYLQKEFANALNVSSGCLSKYETGKCHIPIDILIKSADILGVSLDFITGRSSLQYDCSCFDKIFAGNIKIGDVLSCAMSLPEGERMVMYEVLVALNCKQRIKKAKGK